MILLYTLKALSTWMTEPLKKGGKVPTDRPAFVLHYQKATNTIIFVYLY